MAQRVADSGGLQAGIRNSNRDVAGRQSAVVGCELHFFRRMTCQRTQAPQDASRRPDRSTPASAGSKCGIVTQPTQQPPNCSTKWIFSARSKLICGRCLALPAGGKRAARSRVAARYGVAFSVSARSDCAAQASALAFSRAYSSWVMAPASRSALASAICSAGDFPATRLM